MDTKQLRTETVQEYLARGGVIKVLRPSRRGRPRQAK